MYLGMDLGTTNSAVAGIVNGKARLFKTADGADVLSSVIYVDRRGHRLYGKRAYEQIALSPDNVAQGFKRLMGTETHIAFKASGSTATPEECSAEILRQLVGQAMVEAATVEIDGAVITIPAAFNQMQSEATMRSATDAQLERVGLLQEPIAAAMAAMAGAKNRNGQFLVYDLGGGTFDLALVQSVSGTVNVIGHEGINMLGGQDFDRAIVNGIVRPWLIENFSLPVDFQKHERYRRIVGLANLAAEQAKIELSTAEAATVFVSDDYARIVDDAGRDVYLEIPIARSEFEALIADRVDATIALARKLLKDNGYSHRDIDRIVLIGGPSKMPFIRDRVPRELGVPTDVSIDPMTAVAIGAAIFAESRDWSGEASTRKASRTSVSAEGVTDIRYDYAARTSEDTVTVRLRVSNSVAECTVQIDATTGWTSGRVEVRDGMTVKVPVSDPGDNDFRATVFDESGRPLGATAIKVVRTYASAVGIPATQTLAVKVRDSAGVNRNVLHSLVTKGMLLPAAGSEAFSAAHDLEPGVPGNIELEVYQDEGVSEPELNLGVGVFRVSHTDLPEGAKVRKGDKVVFHWRMDDSGLLNGSVELPSVGQTFETRRFYVDQAGHRSFDGEDGAKLASSVLDITKGEMDEVRTAMGNEGGQELRDLGQRLRRQQETLETASTPDERRAVTEEGRRLRQEISQLRNLPGNRSRVIETSVSELRKLYDQFVRNVADEASNRRFDELAESCRKELERQSGDWMNVADRILSEMQAIYHRNLWKDEGYVVYMFKELAKERYMASDRVTFDRLVQEGERAMNANEIDVLRRIVPGLFELRIQVGGGSTEDRLASIYRG
jgi:molecular chaperone DnaK